MVPALHCRMLTSADDGWGSVSSYADVCIKIVLKQTSKLSTLQLPSFCSIVLQLQWRRSVVKYGVKVSHDRIVSDYTLRQWYPNTQQSRFLAACEAPRKISFSVLPSIFDTSLSSLMMRNLQLSNNSFEWKNVTVFKVKTYADPAYIFSSQDLIFAPMQLTFM